MRTFVKVVSTVTVLITLHAGVALAADEVYFYYTDPVGTPVAISNAGGSVVWQADYMPFGEELLGSATLQNNKMFVGKERDSETGLYYFGMRYMESAIGRFISPDPIGAVDSGTGKINDQILANPQRLNFYSYGLNNPYKNFDTNGKWSEKIHNHIIDMAFSSGNYKVSNDLKNVLKQASAYVDTFQDPKESYMHAMSASIYNEKSAEKYMKSFIEANVAMYKQLMAEGYTESAYFYLGEAMHALMDSTSPTHQGFQKWKTSDAVQHIYGERDEVFEANIKYLQESVKLIRELFDEANR